ncbi:hypothetical protein [Paenibacillus sp. NPDC057967]|uniref:hypothetical protein n=1 Tax=Paenibacillus sp. NPDC057967 TaxID=3346293 RepID=UPI0036DF7F6C
MVELMTVYERLVEEEDELLNKLEICEGCIACIFEYLVSKKDVHIGESVLTAVHTIAKDLQTELLHLRLEKGLLADRIKLAKYS